MRASGYHEIGPRFGVIPELIADFQALTAIGRQHSRSARVGKKDRRGIVAFSARSTSYCQSRARARHEVAAAPRRWRRSFSPTRRLLIWLAA